MSSMGTGPKSYLSLGAEALPLVDEARPETCLPFVAGVTCTERIEVLGRHMEMLQVVSRTMHNASLLKELGRVRKPVLLNQSFAPLLSEWPFATEHIMQRGNRDVALCERGISLHPIIDAAGHQLAPTAVAGSA